MDGPGPATEERVVAVARLLDADRRFCTAFVFGSAARGAGRPGSDIDIGVVYRDGAARESVEGEFLTVLGRLGMTAGADVHLVDLEAAGHILRFQVFRGGRKLFDRDPARTARLHERTLTERFDWLYAMAVQDEAEATRVAAGARRLVRDG